MAFWRISNKNRHCAGRCAQCLVLYGGIVGLLLENVGIAGYDFVDGAVGPEWGEVYP